MVVFTNGVFDVLHAGHVSLLRYCRELAGDGRVVVAINSDDSVKRLKGENRPIFTVKDRSFVLKSISYVDDVIVFEDETPLNLIKALRPDIIVKGGDYRPEDVVGYGICEIKIFNYMEGYSSSRIIKDLSHR